MSHMAMSRHPLTEFAVQLAPRISYLAAISVVILGVALYVPGPRMGLVLLAVGLTLLLMAVMVTHLAARDRRRQVTLQRSVASFVERDASPSFTTNRLGQIGYRNRAARERFGADAETLLSSLKGILASPSATLYRLQSQAMMEGFAREDVVVRRGHVRLSVHQVGAEGFLWRLEDIAERTNPGRNAEGISLPMMTISKAGTVLFMNDALRRLMGGRVSNIDRIFNDLPMRAGGIHEVAAAEGPVSVRVSVVHGAGARREVFLLPEDRDVTEADPDWDLLDELPVPLMKVTPTGEIQLCNRLARELLSIGTFANERLSDFVEGMGRSISDWLLEATEAKGETPSEFVRASRREKDVYLRLSVTRAMEQGKTVLILVLNDATKLKTLEAQFVQSQKMQAIGQLAGGVAHDFNNLLTAISGHCDLLMLRHDQGDPDYGDLEQINQNANRAASLVGQLLAFSRKQTLKPEVIEVRDALEDLTHLLGRLVGERITLNLNYDLDVAPIRADKRQLEQVIMNLVVNARDAMPDGGEISISSRMIHLQTPYERDRAVVPPGSYVAISVSDQGTGISSDQLPKIFEPFYTTKRTGEGTGLGLSMAYGIVKQTGGYIFADSVVGTGTNFTLYFPAHIAAEPEVETVVAALPKPTHNTTGGVVLLVEDEAPVRAFASRALKMRGYTVLEAESAEEALRVLEDPTLEIDVFVTDVVMPGMDGPSWVAQALVDRPNVKVVFVSGYAEDSFPEQQARIPNSVFLPKPFSLAELTATVQGQIH